jgi:hypothetical protein
MEVGGRERNLFGMVNCLCTVLPGTVCKGMDLFHLCTLQPILVLHKQAAHGKSQKNSACFFGSRCT